jgi:hypothetical protein
MCKCVSGILRKIALELQEKDDGIKKEYTIENPVMSLKVKHPEKKSEESEGSEESDENKKKKPLIDVEERDVREAKRPVIKPSRRQESFRSKWKGEGSREVRKEYQKQYRVDNGNKGA